jgi:hypothetical protein
VVVEEPITQVQKVVAMKRAYPLLAFVEVEIVKRAHGVPK